ncbi:hypothetical protein AVP42_01362 [Agromyces sp. NDB4Y10]|nr:hypothetical protein AVP42_01362 [Agromyces sp. NDB4Y10]
MRDGRRGDLRKRVLHVLGDRVRALVRLVGRGGLRRPAVVPVGAAAVPAALDLLLRRAVLRDRLVVDDDAASGADLARLGERLEQAEPELLAGHLHEAEGGDLGDLVLRAVAREALDESTQHEVAVGLEHHVDEVDDDDAADVAESQLADDLLRRLEVVLGDRLLEVAAGADELARVDVDDGHRLGAVDDQRTAGRQPHLALERLLDLLGDAELVERVALALVGLDALEQVRRDLAEVLLDRAARLVAGDDHLLEVLVEDVADDLDEQVGLGVQERRRLDLLDGLRDVGPLADEPVDVARELLLGGALGRGAHDDALVLGEHLLQDLLQARALRVGELAADAVHGAVRHVHEVAAGQRDLAGQACALVAHRVLRDLDEHPVARLQRELDASGLVLLAVLGGGIPVDLAGVQHGVAPAADVDERGLHARQHVLHAAEVHVADERGVLVARDVVLDEHAVLHDADLDAAALLAHDHLAVDRLAAREELRLGDHGSAAPGVTTVAATLLLRLEARGALDLLRLGDQLRLAGLADLDDRVLGLVAGVARLLAAAAAGPAADARTLTLGVALAVAVPIAAVGPVGPVGGRRFEHGRGVEDQRGGRQHRGDRRRRLGPRVGSGGLGPGIGRSLLSRRLADLRGIGCRGVGRSVRHRLRGRLDRLRGRFGLALLRVAVREDRRGGLLRHRCARTRGGLEGGRRGGIRGLVLAARHDLGRTAARAAGPEEPHLAPGRLA